MWEARHIGIDIEGEVGTPILAVANGIVELVHVEHMGGNVIRVYHGQTKDGTHVVSAYVHLDETFVKAGQKVKRGQKIATMGRSCRAITHEVRTHLHLTVIDIDDPNYLNLAMEQKYHSGKRVDPKKYFPRLNPVTPNEKIMVECFEPGKTYNFPDITFTYPVKCGK